MKNCYKCDDRGMIQDDKYSSHSCDCGLHNRIYEKIFESISIEQLLAYGAYRVEEKNKQTI